MAEWKGQSRGASRGRGRGRGDPAINQPWRNQSRGHARGHATASGSTTSVPLQRNPLGSTRGATFTGIPPGSSAPQDVRRRMNLMASISRSSGLEKDGDDLKNYATQEEYHKFIQDKADEVLQRLQNSSQESEQEKKLRIENQENLLILFRKLREGVASSNRSDSFAIEVYETSLYLSIVFASPKQTTSIIPHLFPPSSDPGAVPSTTLKLRPSCYALLCSVLHHLVAYYPSQGQYFQHLQSISSIMLPKASHAEPYAWLSSLSKNLRTRNYPKLASLTTKTVLLDVIDKSTLSNPSDQSSANPQKPKVDTKLGLEAVLHLLNDLRQKSSMTTWSILRSAYRELSTDADSSEGKQTSLWLQQSLLLDSVDSRAPESNAESWLLGKVEAGHVRKKDNAERRWIVCKIR